MGVFCDILAFSFLFVIYMIVIHLHSWKMLTPIVQLVEHI